MGTIAAGVGTGVLLFVLLLVPVIATLLLPPVPITLSPPLAFAVFGALGAVIGMVLQLARHRRLFAGTVTIILALVAVWLQRGTWLPAPFLPSPPLLPHVAPTVTLVTGAFLATTLFAEGRSRGQHAARGEGRVASAIIGALAGASVGLVVEADVWGLGVFQRTFQGPFGLSRPVWLALVFAALLVVGVLVGWLAASRRHGPLAPAIAAVVVVGLVAASFGLGAMPPRTTLYGLSLGLLVVATVAGLRPSRTSSTEPADAP